MTHTPGPWRLVTKPYEGWTQSRGFLGQIVGADDTVIYHGPSSFQALVGDANAERIVLCVNAHDDLVAALQEATTHLASLGEQPAGRVLHTADLNAIDARVRSGLAALAAVKGVPA